MKHTGDPYFFLQKVSEIITLGFEKYLEIYDKKEKNIPDWEIACLKDTAGFIRYKKLKNTLYPNHDTVLKWVKESPYVYQVDAVFRKSTNQTFNVGEMTAHGKIQSFGIFGSDCIAYLGGNRSCLIQDLLKIEMEPTKNHEIQSFKFMKNHSTLYLYHRGKDGKFSNSLCGTYTEGELLKMLDDDTEIASIKRLSDGEVFSVHEQTRNGQIAKFIIKDNKALAKYVPEFESPAWDISFLEKNEDPQVLFKTEDGVDVYPHYIVWHVFNDFGRKDGCYAEAWVPRQSYAYTSVGGNEHYKVFAFKQKAQEYIYYNEPLFINERGERFTRKDMGWRVTKDWHIRGFIGLNDEYDRSFKYFKTLEDAEEYVILNKPMLSYADIKCFADNTRDILAVDNFYSGLKELAKSKIKTC